VKAKTQEKEMLLPDNLITKELYENKIDFQIFQKLKEIYSKSQTTFSKNEKRKRSQMVSHLIQDRHILIDEIELLEEKDASRERVSSHGIIMTKIFQSPANFNEIEDLQEEDIEEEMEKILSKIILHHKLQYSEAIVYPKVFTAFLEGKLEPLRRDVLKPGFNIDKDTIGNKDSIEFLTYCLNVLLGIEVSEREQKANIIKNMVNEGIISEEQSIKVLTKKLIEKSSSFDSDWILRKAFLSNTNQ
jgi:hypothetical protein